jgi:formate transporter
LNIDALPPREIARRVQSVGTAKARTDSLTLLTLAVLAGAFISLGAIFFTVVVTGAADAFGFVRLVGGLAFSLGLVLVIVAGAELFTGNNLIAMAWASGRIGSRQLVRNWVLVYVGNVVGALGTVALVYASGIDALAGGGVGETAMSIAAGKASLPLVEACARGILCNTLVCLAVWICMGARSVSDKILAIVFPITAFVACGFEHSIANWFFLPYGFALGGLDAPGAVSGAVANLAVVTIGNVIGGTLLVAGVYWTAYARNDPKPAEATDSTAPDSRPVG